MTRASDGIEMETPLEMMILETIYARHLTKINAPPPIPPVHELSEWLERWSGNGPVFLHHLVGFLEHTR